MTDNADLVARSGGCLCGAVSDVVTGEPLYVGLCHCQGLQANQRHRVQRVCFA